MRLTCPNCGAQYEVPDEVIPETGRDVQCSNCGDTWFQHHPDHQPSEEPQEAEAPHPGWDSPEEEAEPDFAPEEDEFASEEEEFAPEETQEEEPEADDESAFDHEPQQYSEDAADPDLEDSDEEPQLEDDEPQSYEAPEFAEEETANEGIEEEEPRPQRRGLDPSIADVLREEAAREQEARANEDSGGLETQPDLGLEERSDETDQRSQQAKSRMARLRGLPEDDGDDGDEPEPDPGLISRRNLLPDIDEINSSLDSESARAEADHATGDAASGDVAVARKSGFNRGFMRAVLLVLILVVLYLLGPMIAEKVPALAGVMSTYVDTVNAGRLWLNDMVGTTTAPQ
ncbi:zinc-ribbon domain-containing protein [uncultured Roseovarius sp.]|uniref:zinc-ribbon domain-containing protein n=1 Tax=uncultured Roseovarius sp. TaxID=293344 RepID=UPI00262811C3|nr:zinc-ribbon domain-containing protein [uncultured Roseovarius sp.]